MDRTPMRPHADPSLLAATPTMRRGTQSLDTAESCSLTSCHSALGHIPRKEEAAVPVWARTCPLAPSGLPKNRSRWHVPACTFAPQASGRPSSDREDRRRYPTLFIRWGVEPVYMM